MSMSRLSILLSVLLLTACSGQQIRPPTQDPVQEWRRHQQQLQGLTHWNLRGRIALKSGREGLNANIFWRQWDENYYLRLSGPFGLGALTLAGNPQGVALRDRGETALYRGDAEQLFFRRTGMRLPVESLSYWVRGIPRQGATAKIVLDDRGRLKSLRQSGWKIDYRRYTQQQGVALPAKLFLENRQIKVRLVIDRWIPAIPPARHRQKG